jgi:hypothetical protein
VGEDRTGATGADRRRLTVPQAAEALGVTVDAVRGRIRRGKLNSEQHAGTVYVWLDAPRKTTAADRQRLVTDRRTTSRSASKFSGSKWPPSGSSCRPSAKPTPKPGACSWLPWSGSHRS